MAILHQVIAKQKTVRQNYKKEEERIYHGLQKKESFNGLLRTFTPIADDGYVYPPEGKRVMQEVLELLSELKEASKIPLNLMLESDRANQVAKADIIIDGETLISKVPVSTLLSLEKEVIVNLKTILASIPTHDPSKTWKLDSTTGLFASEPELRTKTKKITKPVVLYEATENHPAQVKEVSEDIVEGTWKLIEYTSSIPFDEAKSYAVRCHKLLVAVQEARARANETVVERTEDMNKILDYIFGDS